MYESQKYYNRISYSINIKDTLKFEQSLFKILHYGRKFLLFLKCYIMAKSSITRKALVDILGYFETYHRYEIAKST